jgi:hypothetical protein
MDDFASDTDSDYTSYWRDWVSVFFLSSFLSLISLVCWWGGLLVGVLFWSVVCEACAVAGGDRDILPQEQELGLVMALATASCEERD